MGRVKYELQHPDTVMSGAGLDTFLTSVQTQSASLDGDNFRDRGLDHRAAAANLVAEVVGSVTLVPRSAQQMSASYALLEPASTAFATAEFTIETYDVVELEASLYISAQTSATKEGLLAGDVLFACIESKVSGGSYQKMVGSERRMGNPASSVTNANGQTEPNAHHGSMALFAVWEGASGTTVQFRVVVKSNNTNDVYFEDCSFTAIRLRRAG